MDNIVLTKLNNNLMSGRYIFNNASDTKLSFEIPSNQNVSILFINLNKDIEININVNESSLLKCSFLQEKPLNLKINGAISNNSHITFYCADFADHNINVSTDISLNGEDAECNWNLACLSKNDNNKKYDVSVKQNAKKTLCEINNYGVARDNSILRFEGICHIINGAHNSIAHQTSKIMIFDEASNGIAKPILKIDDNEIEASHAATVGKLSDDHLFYLTSRGLSIEESRRLITYGYLKPILNGFEDEELQNQISTLIARGV